MARELRGGVLKTRDGYGIRWREDGKRPQRSGFPTKTAARQWYDENVKPRLRSEAPTADITFDAFCELYLERHGATVSERTKQTIAIRLASARERFGDWSLRELEGASGAVAAWRASLRTDSERYRFTGALRQ